MTHELKELLEKAFVWQQRGAKAVLATVVALDGSSYRRPGVRMLLHENGTWVGAVSGGCVEKEVYHQSQSVFRTQKPKMMSYDGRYRLGCEGTLYILLEPIHISPACFQKFNETLQERKEFTTNTYYERLASEHEFMGTILELDGSFYNLSPSDDQVPDETLTCFSQTFSPIFQLYIFGAEHDAVQLCNMAAQLGWEVHIVAPPDEAKSLEYFVGAKRLLTPVYDAVDTAGIDENSAVVLMTHSFNKDIQYLMALRTVQPAYFGVLGPSHRRERLFSQFLDYFPDTASEFFEKINGPAGINIGAESASEIALSILAEILSVVRKQTPIFLKNKMGHIHE